MSVVIRELQKEDLVLMAEMIRPMDRFEFNLMSNGQSVEECLQNMLRRSRRARAAYFDGNLVAVYGVLSSTMLSNNGNPWMAATNMIDRSDVRRLFIERTRFELAWLSEGFSLIWNIVSVENSIAIRWLKWVGFIFDGTEYNISGHRFLKFQMEE
jgi:hypothetical protein